MIISKKGSIFDSTAECLVNPVNCQGVMGAGLAKEFARRSPEMLKQYQSFCKQRLVKLGTVYLYKSPYHRDIVNFPTKDHWKDKSELKWIVAGCLSLRELIDIGGINSLAVPALGCGLGGLEFSIVFEILKGTLYDFRIPIEVYPPQG